MISDTGMNKSETRETLLQQQRQLLAGKKLVQMFPLGTRELQLPKGFERVATGRGTFHFDPTRISAETIKELSAQERENMMLGLGPFNKADIFALMQKGEKLLVLMEQTASGVEVKAAVGTRSTIQLQYEAFQEGKLPETVICVKKANEALLQRGAV